MDVFGTHTLHGPCSRTTTLERFPSIPNLAGYKLRQVVLVDEIAPPPQASLDYPLARQAAANRTAVHSTRDC
jgi:hypothetical protein